MNIYIYWTKKKFKAQIFLNKAKKKKNNQNLRLQFDKTPINKPIINSKNNSRKKYKKKKPTKP